MSEEDKKFLEEAMKNYTFNDSDRLKQIVKQIDSEKDLDQDKFLDLLDELLELVEMNPRNNINLCLSGGLQVLFNIILTNENGEIKRGACSIASSCLQNNIEVQKVALKLGVFRFME